jgi:N-acetyl-anhydromuramyl-L-alanine amidase AmpD
MVPDDTTLSETDYGGFFKAFPTGLLRRHDNDDHHHFGGKVHKDLTGTPIQELQEDLAAIGYSVGTPDGDFGQKLEMAVQMFQEHFFSGPRKRQHLHKGQVDRATAEMIKKVRP